MATGSKLEHKKIKVTGLVSVKRVDMVQHAGYPRNVLIMGPTGAGKCSFIEALGLKGSPPISSHGLNAYTQTVCTYKLNNVTHESGSSIYVVDSPGFADTKLSEMAIVSMLQKWMKDNDGFFHRILYLTPITTVRLPGTQRQVLSTFQALTGLNGAKGVMIVTTMWDNIWGENAARRVEETYHQLQSEIWKDFIEEGARMTRFHNTKESAISILDHVFSLANLRSFSIEVHQNCIKGSPFETNLLTDLQDRVQNLHFHIHTLIDELAQAQGNKVLESDLLSRLQEAEADLARFQSELDDSGLLPPPFTSSVPYPEARSTSPPDHTTRNVQQFQNPCLPPPQEIYPPQSVFHAQLSSPAMYLSLPAPIYALPGYSLTSSTASRAAVQDVQAAPQELTPVLRA